MSDKKDTHTHKGGALYVKPFRTVNYKRKLTSGFEKKEEVKLPDLGKDDIRILIFGGVEEIGKNMSAIEFRDEILIVDCGIMFAPNSLPGTKYVIPNVDYLEQNKHRIKGIFLTHAHLDHIGSIPFLIEKFGYPPIYSRKLTNTFVEKKQREFPNLKPLSYTDIEVDQTVKISDGLSVSFFAVTHTIPDAMGTIIETPFGDIVFTGDLKLTHKNGVVDEYEVKEFEKFKGRKILATLADSTNAEQPGFSVSEEVVVDTISNIIKNAPGRVLIGSFASQIDRNVKIIEETKKFGKKVAIGGASLKMTLGIAHDLGILKMDTKTLINLEDIKEHKLDNLVIFLTGSLAEDYSQFDLLSKGVHRFITLNKKDTIIFSSSIIPGKEASVQNLKDKLSRYGANIVTYQTQEVHSSGHANRDELRWIHEHIKTKFFIPVHGYHYMLTAHAAILKEIGLTDDDIVLPDNGSIIDIVDKGEKIVHRDKKISSTVTIVDGNAIGSIQELVIRDRLLLAQDGMFVAIIWINRRTKKLQKSPDIISRGFIYMKEEQQLLQRARFFIKNKVEENVKDMSPIDINTLKKTLMKDISNFLLYETDKKPIVIPVVFVM